MKEYIERGALHRKFWFNDKLERIPETDIDGFPITIDLHTIKQAIRDIPAADVVEVVRGEWEMLTADLTDWNRETYVHWLKCSLCEKAVPLRFKSNFCPHCGAHMVERRRVMPFKPQSVEEEMQACAEYFARTNGVLANEEK